MPRARDKNKFRRGSEQKYHRTANAVSSRSRTTVSSMHIPNWLILTLVFSVGIFISMRYSHTNPTTVLHELYLHPPTVNIPQLAIPTLKFPTLSIPEVKLPPLPIPSFPRIQFSLPRITINLSPLWNFLNSVFVSLTTTTASIIHALGKLSQSIALVSITWTTLLLQRLDPRPFFPVMRETLITFSTYISLILRQVVQFVDPRLYFSLAYQIELVCLKISITIGSEITWYAWQTTSLSVAYTYQTTAIVQSAAWGTVIFTTHTIYTMIVAFVHGIQWLFMTLYSIILFVIEVISSVIQRIGNAIHGTFAAVVGFFRPYVSFIAQGLHNGTMYLDKSSEQTKQIMGGLMNQYDKTTPVTSGK